MNRIICRCYSEQNNMQVLQNNLVLHVSEILSVLYEYGSQTKGYFLIVTNSY